MRRVRFYSSSSYWTKIQYTDLRFFDRRNSLPSVGIPEWDGRQAARLLKQTRSARRSRGWTHCLLLSPAGLDLECSKCGPSLRDLSTSSLQNRGVSNLLLSSIPKSK